VSNIIIDAVFEAGRRCGVSALGRRQPIRSFVYQKERGVQGMKLRETIRFESSEFRRAVARARRVYGDWLERCTRSARIPRHVVDKHAEDERDPVESTS